MYESTYYVWIVHLDGLDVPNLHRLINLVAQTIPERDHARYTSDVLFERKHQEERTKEVASQAKYMRCISIQLMPLSQIQPDCMFNCSSKLCQLQSK